MISRGHMACFNSLTQSVTFVKGEIENILAAGVTPKNSFLCMCTSRGRCTLGTYWAIHQSQPLTQDCPVLRTTCFLLSISTINPMRRVVKI